MPLTKMFGFCLEILSQLVEIKGFSKITYTFAIAQCAYEKIF